MLSSFLLERRLPPVGFQRSQTTCPRGCRDKCRFDIWPCRSCLAPSPLCQEHNSSQSLAAAAYSTSTKLIPGHNLKKIWSNDVATTVAVAARMSTPYPSNRTDKTPRTLGGSQTYKAQAYANQPSARSDRLRTPLVSLEPAEGFATR